MSFSVQRGVDFLPAADAGRKLVRWSSLRPASGPIFSLFLKNQEPWLHCAETQSLTRLEKAEDLYRAPLCEGLTLWTAFLPPWVCPDLDQLTKQPGIYLPFQGWWEGQWYDGPLLHFGAAAFYDAVPAGTVCRLTIGSSREPLMGLGAFLDEQRIEALKNSFILAFRQKCPLAPTPAYGFQPEVWDLATVFSLLMHRIAYPEQRFFLQRVPERMPEAWKRLAQNLNIEIPRVAPPTIMIIPSAPRLAPASEVLAFLSELMVKAPFIPGKLWQLLKGSGAIG